VLGYESTINKAPYRNKDMSLPNVPMPNMIGPYLSIYGTFGELSCNDRKILGFGYN